MPPVVAKVVDVHHRFAFGFQNPADRHPAFVNDLDISLKSIIIRHAPIQPILFPLVQVAIGPAENGLESVVEAAQRYRARDLDSSPNGRFDVILSWWIEGLILAVGIKAYCPPGTGSGFGASGTPFVFPMRTPWRCRAGFVVGVRWFVFLFGI